MALTLRGSGQVSADNYGIDSDGSITATGKSFIKNNNSYATSSQTSYDNASLRLDNITGSSSIGTSFGVITPNVNYIQSGYNEGTTAPLTLNPYGGNVGIGETSPDARFHIKNSLASTGVGTSSTAIVVIQNERLNTGSSSSVLRFDTNEITGTNQYSRAAIGAEYDGASNVNGRLMFSTADSSGNLQERMRIDASGNVGIGTAPSATYSAFSTIEFTTASIISQNTATGGASPDGNLVLGSNMNYSSGGGPEYKFTGKATQITQIDGNITLGVATSGTANTNITYNTGLEVLNDGKARAKNGLLFGTDTAAANALDDYEFGSGNATITGSGGGTITTNGDKTYYYTKIGNLVHFQVEFTLTGIAGCSGATQIALPFQSRDYVAGPLRAYTATYTGNSLFCEAHPSGTQVLLKSQSSGNASHDVLSSTTSYYFVTLTYLTW
jgi:hypothetical protein